MANEARAARMGAGWERFEAEVLGGPGRLPRTLRRGLHDRARGEGGGESEVAAGLAELADVVAQRSYQMTDGQVAELRAAGRSEDEIFEAVVVAAVGAASVHRDAARRALAEAAEANGTDGTDGQRGTDGAGDAPRHP